MSTQVQRRKGTTAQHASFTGASAELTVDTTKNTVVVHDGATAGGIPLAKETGSAISATSLTSSGASVISVTDNTNAALRITQLGTGNALLVEDSANPDTSPVVITNNGTLIVGNTARVTSTSLIEAHSSAAIAGTPAIANYSWGTIATGGSFNLYKSRSGTVGTQALVAANTQSSVRFYFDDGVAFQQGASIIGAAEGTPALNSMPGRLTFNTTADGSVTPTERMRIDSAGNVGIGTTSPSFPLDVQSTGTGSTIASRIYRSDGTIALLRIGNSSSGSASSAPAFGSDTTAAVFYTSNAEKMRLDASGNLGLGVTPSVGQVAADKVFELGAVGCGLNANTSRVVTLTANTWEKAGVGWAYGATSQASMFQQQGGAHYWFNAPSGTAGAAITFTQAMTLDASGNLLVGTTSVLPNVNNGVQLVGGNVGSVYIGHFSGAAGGSTYANFAFNGSAVGSITQNGATGVLYNITSDYRLKDIAGPLTTSGAFIDSLKPVQGSWKADGSRFVGLIAHELQEASETVVGTGVKDGTEMQSIDYSNAELIANLIAELQDLRARVASLESK